MFLSHTSELRDFPPGTITLFEQTVAQRERVLGADHPDTLASRSRLGSAYRIAGCAAEAIALLEQTVAARVRVLGNDHPETLFSRNNLGAAYRVADRAAEAITLHEQTLADRERVLGNDHPDTLNTAMSTRSRLPERGPYGRGDHPV